METLTAPAAPASAPPLRQAKKPENKAAMEASKRAKILRGWVVKANKAYKLIEPGDRVMVCLSGGKDSFALLEFLLSLQRAKQPEFDLIAVNLDQKQPGFPAHVLPAYLSAKGVPFEIVEQDTYSVVKRLIPEGNTTCSLCSRLRRGALYAAADRLGCTKIALGHHRDDVLQTFFLNLFYHGRLKTMPPKLVSDDGRHTVIRPLVFCKEADLELYAEDQQFPIIPCDLCGSQPDLQRAAVKAWLRQWDKSIPGRNDNIFHALQEVVPSHLFDTNLFDFAALKADGQPRQAAFEGDHGFS